MNRDYQALTEKLELLESKKLQGVIVTPWYEEKSKVTKAKVVGIRYSGGEWLMNRDYMEHWFQPVKYLITNPNTPTRAVRRHSKLRKRCDGNGILTRGRR